MNDWYQVRAIIHVMDKATISFREAQEALWYFALSWTESDPKVRLAIWCKRDVELMVRRMNERA